MLVYISKIITKQLHGSYYSLRSMLTRIIIATIFSTRRFSSSKINKYL